MRLRILIFLLLTTSSKADVAPIGKAENRLIGQANIAPADDDKVSNMQFGYQYQGLDLLLCPWSYKCGGRGKTVFNVTHMPETCCSGCIICYCGSSCCIMCYGPFRNCQSWSFITVHGQIKSNRLGLYCEVTIGPRKHKRKTPSQASTRSKQIYRIGRSL